MTAVAFPPRFAVNPFDHLEGGVPPDSIKRIPPTLDEAVQREIAWYQLFIKGKTAMKDRKKGETKRWYPALNPQQVDTVLQYMLAGPMEPAASSTLMFANVSIYLNSLLGKSFKAGYNDFILTMRDAQMDFLCTQFIATQDRPFVAKIIGSVGNSFCMGNEYCKFDVTGSVGEDCAKYAKYCDFVVQGNMGKMLFMSAERCEARVYGKIGRVAEATPYKCVLYLKDEPDYHRLKKRIPSEKDTVDVRLLE